MGLKRKVILLFTISLAVLLLASTVYGALIATKSVVSNGRIITANVGVYSDSACTQAASSISWGDLKPGDNATFAFWVKNTGKSSLTLTMTADGWSPTIAQQGLTVNWNRQNTVLSPNQVMNATITLAVSPSIDSSVDTFGFNTTVTGTG